MKPLSYYVDRLITFVYIASLVGGVLACTTYDANAAAKNRKLVNIRCVASTSENFDHMSADDFLFESEKAADKENITQYLENLKKNGFSGNEEADEAAEDMIEESIPEIEEETESSEDAEESKDSQDTVKIDPDDWRLMLVNKQNPVPEGFDVKLANINGSQYADSRIIPNIYRMIDAASADGVDLMICSAYRSYDRQRTLFNNKINKLMASGMTYLESYKVGSMSVTVPGTSEHHLGLALDILTGSYTGMDDGFGDTKAGKWLAKNSADYGFILRYPKGKENITGIIYEPWHFRYVGVKYAKDITEKGVCLEEYLKGDL